MPSSSWIIVGSIIAIGFPFAVKAIHDEEWQNHEEKQRMPREQPEG